MKPSHSFEKFGNYLLLERIAAGGMAAIYLARPADQAANGRLLAIKRILPQAAADPEFQRMFQTEIQVCMGFNHPNIVHLHDFGRVNGQPYIAMEYVEGRNLRQIVGKYSERNQSVPVPVAASIVSQAAAALHYAHTARNRLTGEALNIIHRDVSPQNILVSYGGNAKLIDFGIAKAEIDAIDHTRTGSIKGKVCYLSPEQARREQLDPRTDIFSLGAVLWELLTGQKLFTLLGRGDVEVMLMITQCEKHVRPPSVINPQVPPELDAIVLKALQKDPADRFQSAAEMQNALRGFLTRRFPDFSYGDVAHAMHEMFASDEAKDRQKIQNLNSDAQTLLTEIEENHSRTTILPPPPPATMIGHPTTGERTNPSGLFPSLPLQTNTNPGLPTWPGTHAGQPGTNPGYPSSWPGSPMSHPGMPGSYTPGAMPMPAMMQPGAMMHPGMMQPAPPRGLFPSITRTKLLLGLLYVATIWFLQVDRDYMFFERFFLPADYVRLASTESQAAATANLRKSIAVTAHEAAKDATRQEAAANAALARATDPAQAPATTEPLALVPPPRIEPRAHRSAPRNSRRAASAAPGSSTALRLIAPRSATTAQVSRAPAKVRAPASLVDTATLQLAISPVPRDSAALRVLVNGRAVALRGTTLQVPLHQPITLRVEQPEHAPYQSRFTLEPMKSGKNNFRLKVAMKPARGR